MISARRQELAKTVAFKLSKYVHPIYAEGRNATPFLVGSGVLLRVAETAFLLTAAHVIEENLKNDLYTIGQFGTTALEGSFHRNKSQRADHNDEPFDIGVLHLNKPTLSALGEVKALCPSQCAMPQSPSAQRLQLVIGYPHSKNRKVNLPEKKVYPKTFRYYTVVASQTRHAGHGVDATTHILLDFERRHVMPFGGHDQTAPHPAGMSGGALWTSCFREPKLIGILTDWKRRDSFLAVRVSLATEIIRHIVPKSAHLIPTHGLKVNFG